MRLFKTKIFIIFMTFILIILAFVSVKNESVSAVLGNLVSTTLSPFQKVFSFINVSIRGKVSYFIDIDALRLENIALKEQVEKIEKDNRELIEYRQKNAEFKEALNIKDRFVTYNIAGSNIVAKDPGNWFNIFTVDIGSSDGIAENSTVVTGKGLVGRIYQTNLLTSKIITIIDPDSSVSARISKTRDLVVVKGDVALKEFGTARLDYIPNDVDIIEGDVIETSGMGGIFPKGIIIGKIKKIEQSPNEFTKQAEIDTAVDFKRLEEVYVLSLKK